MSWPTVGEIYWAPSHLFPGDPELERPLVVVETPRSELDRVEVITRTHDLHVRGIRHSADPENGCNLDGVFALKNLHRINFDDFIRYTTFCGCLRQDVLDRVLDMWRNG